MMKALVTEGQARSIEFLRGLGYSDEEIMSMYVDDALGYIEVQHGRSVGCLYDLDALRFATALINGYEVEKTPEEKVREYYDELCEKFDHACWSSDELEYGCKKQAVRETLDKLGIKIEGVNV